MRRSHRNRQSPAKTHLPVPFELEIENFSHDGRGIGRHNGRVVMVNGALPGERVLTQVEKANSKLWQGKALEVIGADSPERRVPVCPHYMRCGGCQLQHISHSQQVELKQSAVSDHLRRNGIAVPSWEPPILSSELQYRSRARFHIDRAGVLGFHGPQGNDHVAIDQCPVLVPELLAAFNQIRQLAPLKGLFQLEVVVSDSGQIGIKAIKGQQEAIADINQWAQAQGWSCDQPLEYHAGTRLVTAAPGEFTQVNRAVNERMLAQASNWLALESGSRVLDLFCGNGNFSLALAGNVQAVHGIEGSESSICRAISAAEGLEHCSFSVENLFAADLPTLPEVLALRPDVLLLDPPRAGAEHVCQQLNQLTSLQRILYVSCDPTTLARDLNYLQRNKWHLRKVGLIDMFPQTRHIETMVLLEK